jgi:hypothetical protein
MAAIPSDCNAGHDLGGQPRRGRGARRGDVGHPAVGRRAELAEHDHGRDDVERLGPPRPPPREGDGADDQDDDEDREQDAALLDAPVSLL